MTKTAFNRLAFIILPLIFFGYGPAATAQQAKPVAAKTASRAAATQCTKKGMACCKGTPSRAAVLAVNLLKIKPVKK